MILRHFVLSNLFTYTAHYDMSQVIRIGDLKCIYLMNKPS